MAGSEAREKGRMWENIRNGLASIFVGMVCVEIFLNNWPRGPGQVTLVVAPLVVVPRLVRSDLSTRSFCLTVYSVPNSIVRVRRGEVLGVARGLDSELRGGRILPP